MKKKAKKYKPQIPAGKKKEVKTSPLSRQQSNLALVLILLFTFVAYIPALKAGFVNWDDPDYISNNPMIKNISNLEMIFTTPIQGNYHPLTVISLILNYYISGFDAWSYHLLNILLHLSNCFLVFRLALLLSRNNLIIAFTTSLLFGIHPMHVESVAWVSERKDVLYSLFFLAGLISYLRFVDTDSKKQYWLSVLFLVLSLLSKPAAVIFPLVLFSIDILRNRRFSYRLLLEKTPFFILALAMGLLTFVAQKEKGATEALNIFNTGTRLLMGFYGIMMYFIKLLIPVNLSPFYPFAAINERLPSSYYIAPLFSVLLIALVFYSLKRNRVIVFGILFYLLNLLLVLQFIPVGSAIIADRYTYIPYIGFFYIIGWLIDRYSKGVITRSYYIIIPLAILLGALTFRQSMIWVDGASLWDHAIKTTPGARAYISRANLYKEEKKYELAIQCYNEAIKINIADHEAYMSRGNVYFDMNKPELAFADYKKSLEIKPNYVTALDNIGAIFGLRRQYDSALIYLNKALAVNPGYISSYRNRGLVNIELKQNENALNDFKKILEFSPGDPDIMNMVGLCYRNLGRYNEALKTITQAISIKSDPRYHLNRAYCYIGLKDIESARKDVQIAKQSGLEIDAELAKSLE
ncbi:MAG TPA: tetratricopeptide repeat protein [Chitinophagaceae bacterium]|nr:tetratricopeptide repeat protein [Chitinophagaceae bacterium]